MLINKFNDEIYERFISLYEPRILLNYSILKDIKIELTDNISSHLPEEWPDNDNYEPSPYNCDIERKQIVRYNEEAIGLSEQMHFALIAHEIGHFYINKSHENPEQIHKDEELEADDFAVSLGLVDELIKALRECLVLLKKQEVDIVQKIFFPEQGNKKEKELLYRIKRLMQIKSDSCTP